MTIRIAVCGKGGVGKTTIVCGIMKFLIDKNVTPILAVDADPNSNLAENLGVNYDITIADIREELRDGNIPNNISKSDYITLRLQEAIVEHKGFDLIVMGRPEGRECYCFVNELLRTFLSNLGKSYKFVIIDTEAGMEHLSRRTTDNLDLLVIVSTPTKVSIDTVSKIKTLIPKLKLKILNTLTVINMAEDNLQLNTEYYYVFHKDPEIQFYSEQGVALLDKLPSTRFYSEISQFMEKILQQLTIGRSVYNE